MSGVNYKTQSEALKQAIEVIADTYGDVDYRWGSLNQLFAILHRPSRN